MKNAYSTSLVGINWQMEKVLILFFRHLHVKRKSNSLCPPEENIKKNKEDIKTKKRTRTKKQKTKKKGFFS